jgi:putative transposase
MTGCTASPGSGSQPTVPWAKRRSLPNVLVGTRPTGGKKGRKRSLLVDGRGLPLSIAVSGANLHDSKLLDRTLAQVVVKRPEVTGWENYQYLCLDAGYVGYPVSRIARKHHYYPRVKSRAEERLI